MLGPVDLITKAVALETFGAGIYDPATVARDYRAAAATIAFVNDLADQRGAELSIARQQIEDLKLQLSQEQAERLAAQRRLLPLAVTLARTTQHPTTASKRRKKTS
jgi:hypothetical protein